MGMGFSHGTKETATPGRTLRIGNTELGYLNGLMGGDMKDIELMGSNMGEERMFQHKGIGEKANGMKGSL